MQHRGEPSVEEILESIKKVIDRENRETMQAERHRRETDGVRPRVRAEQADSFASPFRHLIDADDQILDLRSAATEMDDEAEEPGAPDTPSSAEPEHPPVETGADLSEAETGSTVADPAPVAETDPEVDAAPSSSASADDSVEALVTEHAAESMRQSLAALTLLTRGAGKGEDGPQLETMAREMLRPMLAQWLDDNLPDMVERLVKAEIARIAGIEP